MTHLEYSPQDYVLTEGLYIVDRAQGGGGLESGRIDWMDADYLTYILSNEIKLEFDGYPMNVTDIPGGSSSDKFHAVGSVIVSGQ